MNTLRRYAEKHATALVLIALVLSLAALSSAGSEVIVRTATTGMVLLLATVALYIFVGNSGIISFGHAGFMMIGGYAAAILAYPAQQKELLLPDLPGFIAATTLSPTMATIAGGLVAAVVGLALSIPLARLAGMSASLVTFAFLGISYEVVSNWTAVTGGPAGVAGIPIETNLGTATIWAALSIAVASAVQHSSWGRRLRASREDDVVAKACGIGINNERRGAFVLSAFFLGAAGGLYGQFLGNLTPGTIYLDITFITLAMLVIGGMRSLSGAVLGSLFITIVAEALRRAEGGFDLGFLVVPGRSGVREVGLAVAMLAVLLLRPDGLTLGKELPAPNRWLKLAIGRFVRTR